VPPSLVAGRLGGIGEWWDGVVARLTGGQGHAAPAVQEVAPLSAADEPAASSQPPLIRFIHEAEGRWTVVSPVHDYRRSFADLKAALAFARQSYGAAAATLWLSVDGLVVVIPQKPGWPQPVIGDAR